MKYPPSVQAMLSTKTYSIEETILIIKQSLDELLVLSTKQQYPEHVEAEFICFNNIEYFTRELRNSIFGKYPTPEKETGE